MASTKAKGVCRNSFAPDIQPDVNFSASGGRGSGTLGCATVAPPLVSGWLPSECDSFRALYIHVPFCKRRCLYCDFATEAVDPLSPAIGRYVEDMVLSIRRASREGLLGHVETVYLGGGTPTFVGQKALAEILYTLSLSLFLTDQVECTIEANPDSLTLPLVRDLWALGANRISVGVQSFDDAELALLGRVHDADAACRAVELAHDRFSNVSVDLMCGIPGQTLATFERSLRTAIDLGVSHVSVYPLTIEEGTPFDRMVDAGELSDVDADFQADCMELASEVLSDAGMERYEVASYAKPGFACRHNKAYWTGVSYLGLGPSAVSMAQSAHERVRVQDGEVVERLDAAQMLAEDLMLGMRMTCGIGPDLLESARIVFPEFEAAVQVLVDKALARWEGVRFVSTKQGWLCGNELYGTLLDLAP